MNLFIYCLEYANKKLPKIVGVDCGLLSFFICPLCVLYTWKSSNFLQSILANIDFSVILIGVSINRDS